MFSRLNPQPFRWARYVAAFTAVLITVIGLRAAVAYADVQPSWCDTPHPEASCPTTTVPPPSSTAPTTSTTVIIPIKGYCPPDGSTVEGCVPPPPYVCGPTQLPSQTPCDTTPPTPPPTNPTPPTTAVTPPPASDTVTSTSPPTSVPASTAGAAGHPTTISYQLPVTGAEQDFIVIAVVAGSVLIILGSVVLMARSRGRD